MPQGLQIWDASGNLTFDTNARPLRVKGIVNTTAGVSGSVVVDLQGGELFYIVQTTSPSNYDRPAISVSGGNTINWSGGSRSATIFYGTR